MKKNLLTLIIVYLNNFKKQKMKKGKVQTVDSGVNVLVEHQDSTSRHYSHLDKDVLCEKMSEEQINQEFDKLVLTVKDKICFLKNVKGFAISDVRSKDGSFNFGDLFKYTEK